MIRIEHASFAYDGIEALHDVSIEIAPGEAVALMGANGSGKSTLLKLINGIVEPAGGKYLFDGEEITRKNLDNGPFAKSFHRRVGFVFQHSDTQLFCADVFDEVAFGPRQMGMGEADVAKRVARGLVSRERISLVNRDTR